MRSFQLFVIGAALATAAGSLTACAVPCACPVVSPPPAPPPGANPVASAAPVASAVAPASLVEATPPAPPLPPTAPPPALQQALDGAKAAIGASDFALADRQLAAAAALVGGDAHLAFLVARARATRFAYAGDFERAAAALVAVMPALAAHPELPDEFWAHNAMMMLREAQGDPAAALAENDEASLAAARGTWEPAGRDTLAFQKDRWHRAYLTRMLAESRAGSTRAALVAYARAALDEYRARGGFPDSVAVLEAYFAALDGKREEALAAAHRVDPAADDDVEDLYLIVVGLEAGGDHAAAEAVRRAMRAPGGVHLARPIMLRWLELDAARTRFTPWHATSR